MRLSELLFHEGNAKFPSWKDTWIPRAISKRASHYLGRPVGGYLGEDSYNNDTAGSSDEETVVQTKTTKDGKVEKVVVKKPKGPMKGVELQGKVGGRRRVVKNRPTPAKEDK